MVNEGTMNVDLYAFEENSHMFPYWVQNTGRPTICTCGGITRSSRSNENSRESTE